VAVAVAAAFVSFLEVENEMDVVLWVVNAEE